MDISIAILCGGRSRRFGRDKTLYNYHGRPLYMHIYEILSPLTDDIFMQCGKKDTATYRTKSYNDDYLDIGPLGGIYSAIKNSRHSRTLIVGCDMPNINDKLVMHMAKFDADIVVPIWKNGYYEPLCAIYSKKVFPSLEYRILTGDLKISSLFDEFKIKKIKIESLIEQGIISPDLFKNINRIDDI